MPFRVGNREADLLGAHDPEPALRRDVAFGGLTGDAEMQMQQADRLAMREYGDAAIGLRRRRTDMRAGKIEVVHAERVGPAAP